MSLKPKETLPWKMPIFFQFVHTSTLPHFWHNTHKRGWVLLHEFQTPRNRLKHEAVEAHDEARGPSFWQVSKYALYHPTHGKPRPKGRKILFNECAEKLINPENPPSSGNSYFGTGPQSLEAHEGRLLAPLGTPISASAEQRFKCRKCQSSAP